MPGEMIETYSNFCFCNQFLNVSRICPGCATKIPQEEVESATAVVSHEEDIVWTQLLLGSVYGMGQVGVFRFSLGFKKIHTCQVFGVFSLPCSILCYIGVAIFSPTIAIAQFVGSLLACFVALGVRYSSGQQNLTKNSSQVGVSSFSEVYIGVWSYSALLTAGAMVFFTQPSLRFTSMEGSFLQDVKAGNCKK